MVPVSAEGPGGGAAARARLWETLFFCRHAGTVALAGVAALLPHERRAPLAAGLLLAVVLPYDLAAHALTRKRRRLPAALPYLDALVFPAFAALFPSLWTVALLVALADLALVSATFPRGPVVASAALISAGLGASALRAPGPAVPLQLAVFLLAVPVLVVVLGSLTALERESRRRFRNLVDELDAIVWEADPATFRFVFVSRRAERILGYPLHRWLEDDFWVDHVHPEDRERALQTCLAATREGRDHVLEYRMIAADGRPVWLRDVIRVETDYRGQPVRMRGVMFDITERVLAEAAVRRSEQRYAEAFRREREAVERLRAVDEMKTTFLEAVSHELRTPLTAVLGLALTLARDDLRLSAGERAAVLDRLVANADKLDRLLHDLLDLDRLRRGVVAPQLAPADVGELVRGAVEECREALRCHRVEVDVEPVAIPVDGPKVERVVENLVLNAARHTPEGTQVWVRVRREGQGALISVEDDGPGIPAALKEKIFEPFARAGNVVPHAPGVGIGLSLVARFVQLHGGRVWAEDRPGGGAAFRVFLPGKTEPLPDPARHPSAPPKP